MKSFILLLVGVFFAPLPIDSFSIPTPFKPASPLYNTAYANSLGHEATGFWGRPRSEQEIINFVSRGVFDGVHRNGDSNSDSTREERIEVISAEPPVRRRDC